jgi:hypothetical protein
MIAQKCKKVENVNNRIISEYSEFISRKLGLEKKLAPHEEYLYKYHVKLKTTKDRLDSFNIQNKPGD